VKRLVEMHGGTIEARSPGIDMGAEFVVRLPVVVKDVKPERSDANGDADLPTTSLKILIVDDNRDAARTLTALLKIKGHETRTAFDGQQGIELAEEFRPDVVLLDIGLPKLNGYEVCQRLRKREWGMQMVMIAVTGWGQDEDRRRSRDAGFNYHLTKPVMFQDLMRVLSELGDSTVWV
jgi:CheY-like chemotaxis protein